MRYLLSLLPAMLAITGNLLGGWWAGGVSTVFLLLAIPDWLCKSTAAENAADDPWPDLVLGAHVRLQTLAVATLLYGVLWGKLTWPFALLATLSTGLAAGAGGLVAAHELIHRRSRRAQRAGLWLLFLSRYTHYFVEHLQGHHRHVGLENDPTTARYGESFYRFLWRIVPQQFQTALEIEKRRLQAAGQPGLGWHNLVVQGTILEWLFLGGLWLVGGFGVAAAFFGQACVARFFWETGSYVQHYGLGRAAGDRVSAAHSWQCQSTVSRALLLEIVRHSDHHCRVGRSYPELGPCSGSPELPAGSFGLFVLVMLPPAWFAVAHRRLQALAGPAEAIY